MRSALKITAAVFMLSAAICIQGCGREESPASVTPQVSETTAPTATPTETPVPATPTPEPTATPDLKPYEIPREIDESTYLFINDKLSGTSSLTLDVTKMAGYREGAVYQVTLLFADGTAEETDVTEKDGQIVFETKGAVKAEVSPVFRFVFGKLQNEPDPSNINVLAKEAYGPDNWYGFYGTVENLKGGVHLKGTDVCFIAAVPDGYYDILLTKYGTARSLVCVNGEVLGCNVGIPGAGGRKGTTPITYYMEDALVTGGNVRISLGEKDYDLAALEIRRSSTLVERKTHLYLAGDSTCSAYFPIESSEPLAGTFQTGWGQVLNQFLGTDIAITDLGSGGTCAKTWYDIAFSGVMYHAQPGDYFIIMHGINDQSYSNVEEMTSYLSDMIDRCREKEIIPILCTPMQTAKFWRDDKGKDLAEFEAPLGGGKAAYMNAIRKLAADKNVFLIDVADITSNQYGILGRNYVAHNYHLYKAAANVEEDTLHLSYAGAKNVASIIATELYRLQETGKTDGTGKKVTGLSFNPIGCDEITYTDKDGAEQVLKLERISAVYRKYGIREK